MPAIMPTIATTITISMSVTPDSLVLPANDIRVHAVAVGLAVGAQGNQVRLIPMLTRKFVYVRMAPGIVRDFHLQIGAGPLCYVAGIDPQRLQPLFRGGKNSGIELVLSQRSFEVVDLHARRCDARL